MIYNFLIKHRNLAIGLFISFIVFTILVYALRTYTIFQCIYEYIVYWSTALSAFFMLIVAYMAYISIAENRRIRDEDMKRSFRVNSINRIDKWAKEGLAFFTRIKPDTSINIDKNRDRLVLIQVEGIIVSNLAKTFGHEFSDVVEEAIKNLDDYFYFFEQGRQAKTKVEDIPKLCKDSFEQVVKDIAKLLVKEGTSSS